MPETKLKLDDPGTIHLMTLDTTSLLLPFGRPITEYLRGEALPADLAGLVSLRPVTFPPEALSNDAIAARLRTTGFSSLERSGMEELPPPAPFPAKAAPAVEPQSPPASAVPEMKPAAAAAKPAAAAAARTGPGTGPRKPAAPPSKPPAQAKPIALVPPPPKPVIPPSTPRATISQPPPPASALAAARAPEITQKPLPRPERPAPAPAAAKTPIPISAGRNAARAIAAEPPAATMPEPAPAPVVLDPSFGLSAAPPGMLERIPIYGKIAASLLLATGVYFALAPPSSQTAGKAPAAVAKQISAGEQGWSTEPASDPAGSRRGRQLRLYRPSAALSDYRFQFTGRIESKALGWVLRAADSRNYYGAKLVLSGPAALTLTRFAVVEGRETSVIEKPLAVIPADSYNVKVEAAGPRFTIAIDNQPVDSWTDNRLKSGAVGFLNDRDERGAASAVHLSFPRSAK